MADPGRDTEVIERIAGHFQPSRWRQGYVRGKLGSDPAYRAVGWIRGGGAINFPTADEVAAAFRSKGFEEEIRALWGRTPFNSHLLVFRRPGGPFQALDGGGW